MSGSVAAAEEPDEGGGTERRRAREGTEPAGANRERTGDEGVSAG